MKQLGELSSSLVPLSSGDAPCGSSLTKLMEGVADIFIEAGLVARRYEQERLHQDEQQLLALQRIQTTMGHQHDQLSQINQRMVCLEESLSTLTRDLARCPEQNAHLNQRLEALEFNLEQIRLLVDVSAQRQQQLVDDFIERKVTDHLFKEFLNIQSALTRVAANDAETLKANIIAIAEAIATFLSDSGLRVINPRLGAEFEPREHQPIKVVVVPQPDADGTVAETFNLGLARRNRILQPARVAVYKAETPDDSH